MRALAVSEKEQGLELTFALTREVRAGELLRLRAGGVVAMRALDAVRVLVDGEELDVVHRYSREEQKQRWNWYIANLPIVTVRVPRALAAGSTIELAARACPFAVRNRGGSPQGPLQASNPFAGLVWTYRLLAGTDVDAAPGGWEDVAKALDIQLAAGACDRVEAWLRSDGRLAIQHFDAFTNPVAPDAREATVGDRTVPLDDAVAATAIDLDGDAPLRVRVRDDRGREALSSPRPEALDGGPIFFGEFHWHCDFSGDGQRPMADALTSARDELCLDFAGPADHLGQGVSYGERSIHDQRAICEAFDAPGRFVTLPTFERSEREGHANVIADSWDILLEVAEGIARERASFPPDRYPVHELAALCPEGRALLVPHHMNMDSYAREGVMREDGRPYWCRFDWGPRPERKATRLVEIHQQRGCFEDETVDPNWRIDVGGLGSSVRTALARGYRVGFTGGTDNHSGWPARQGAEWCGLTGVAAPALTLKDVFAALHARRCYATTGARIAADMQCNGAPMGSVVMLAPGAPREFRIRIRGTAPLAAVQVIGCGAVLAELPVEGDRLELDTTWADERPGRPLRDCYYYVRARQEDGHCAWLSPVWIELG